MSSPGISPLSSGVDEQPRKSEKTRSDILTTAAKLFRDQGYQATTMQQIARAARLEAGSIYYHFTSKEQILAEVLDIGVRSLYVELKTLIEEAEAGGAPFRETLGRLVETHLRFLLTKSDFTSANIRNYPMLPEELRAPHRRLRHAYAGLWQHFLTRASETGALREDIALRSMSRFILSAMNWTVEWYDAGRYPVGALSKRMTKLLLDGMCVKSDGASVPPVAMTAGQIVIAQFGVKSAQTRLDILKAAARILRDSGYKATTIRRIAAEAKMEPGSVYYHFESKEKIIDEVLRTGLADLITGVSEAVSQSRQSGNYRAAIATAIATHLSCLFSASEFTSANIRSFGMLPKELRQRHRRIRQDYGKIWDDLLREAQEKGVLRPDIEIKPLRQAMLGALNWTVTWFDQNKRNNPGYESLEELSAMLTGLLLDGICKPAGKMGEG